MRVLVVGSTIACALGAVLGGFSRPSLKPLDRKSAAAGDWAVVVERARRVVAAVAAWRAERK